MVNEKLIASGLLLILIGYFKKVAIADVIALDVEAAFSNVPVLSSYDLLAGLYFFSLQIYCDFSGYSDIARGVSNLFGVKLMENFNQPYLSTRAG